MLLLAALSVSIAAAQVIGPGIIVPGPAISADLRVYLELTTDQLNAMSRLNADLRRFQSDKARRMAQVSLELQDEMRKQTLDPMAIGLRYVEMEAIQRELTAKAKETATEVQKQFTAAQRTKLQALLEVLRTYPLACEAISLNLIAPEPNRWFDTGTISGVGSGTGVVGGVIGFYPYPAGCAYPAGIRTGDFAGAILDPAGRTTQP